MMLHEATYHMDLQMEVKGERPCRGTIKFHLELLHHFQSVEEIKQGQEFRFNSGQRQLIVMNLIHRVAQIDPYAKVRAKSRSDLLADCKFKAVNVRCPHPLLCCNCPLSTCRCLPAVCLAHRKACESAHRGDRLHYVTQHASNGAVASESWLSKADRIVIENANVRGTAYLTRPDRSLLCLLLLFHSLAHSLLSFVAAALSGVQKGHGMQRWAVKELLEANLCT